MLSELLGYSVDVRPAKTAIIYNGSQLTYEQVEHSVQQTANWIDAQSLDTGSRIAIIAKNSANYFILYLAIRRTNNIAVLINPKLPDSAQEQMIQSADCKIVFRDTDLEVLPTHTELTLRTCDPNAIGLFLYTSGSTGQPRAAIISNKQRQELVRRLYSLDLGVEFNARIAVSPFYHMNGLSTIENTIAAGGTAVIMPEFDPKEFLELLVKHKVARFTVVPSMIAMCLNEPTVGEYNLSHVKTIILGTSPVTQNLYNRAREVFTGANIKVRYGLTEVGPVFGPGPPLLKEPELTCGYPLKSVQYKLVDGILHLRAPSMSTSYWNSNSSKIVDGWLNTGDLFRIDDNGFYFFVGREDQMYKVGGEQVYPNEIESALENVNGVVEAAVVMLEDDIKGHKPYAFCTGNFDEDAVLTALLDTLPRYKIPRRIWSIDQLPLFGVGKVDKNQLEIRAKELL